MRRTRKKTRKRKLCRYCHHFFIPEDRRRQHWICPFCGKLAINALTKTQMMRICDKHFSWLVRYTRSDRHGQAKCVTCGLIKPWRDLEAGHYMSRTYRATRWLMENVWPQCSMCNTGYGAKAWKPDDNVRKRYEQFLRNTLGEDAPHNLHQQALSGWQPTMDDLEKLAAKLIYQCQESGLIP